MGICEDERDWYKFEDDMEKWEEEMEKRREAEDEREEAEYLASRWGEIAGNAVYPLEEEEKQALVTIIWNNLKLLHAIAYKEVGNYTQAQDSVQNGLYKAYKALQSYSPKRRKELKTRQWLCKAVKNMAWTDNRTRQNHPYVSLDVTEVFRVHMDGKRFDQPEEQQERNELLIVLQQAILKLPPSKREFVILRYLHDYKEGEIAARLGRPFGTIKKYLHDAHALMRHFLEEHGIDRRDIDHVVEKHPSSWLRHVSTPSLDELSEG